jgi:nitroreductase
MAMSTSCDNSLGFIFARRSVRVYSPGIIGDDTVTKLLEAAMAAPSAMTKDPWRFVVIRQKSTLEAMAAFLPGGKMLATASLGIVVCGDTESAFESNVGYMLQDCSASIENLLMAAQVLGLGACWVGVYPAEESVRRLRELLEAPRPIVPIAVISLGLPGEQLPPRTRFNRDFVRSEKW